jgi:hypothetical protein
MTLKVITILMCSIQCWITLLMMSVNGSQLINVSHCCRFTLCCTVHPRLHGIRLNLHSEIQSILGPMRSTTEKRVFHLAASEMPPKQSAICAQNLCPDFLTHYCTTQQSHLQLAVLAKEQPRRDSSPYTIDKGLYWYSKNQTKGLALWHNDHNGRLQNNFK